YITPLSPLFQMFLVNSLVISPLSSYFICNTVVICLACATKYQPSRAGAEGVVTRKGKKVTLQGLKLPQAREVAAPRALPKLLGDLGGLNGDVTSVTRNNDEFTARHVSGEVFEGKAEPSEITIEQDGKSNSYDSADSE